MVLVYLSPYRVLVTFFIASLCGLLIQAQNQAGFISIDCGASADEKYTEESTGIDYISDANFITTGVSKSIASDLKGMSQQQMWNVRSFPEGRRNCYKINITINSKYLIRTVYLYGNYDGLNKTPKFGLLLGPNFWHTVTIHNASIFQYNEIIHVPTQDYVQICLVDTGLGTPFISAIELRTLTDNLYVQSGSWETQRRWDLGSNKSYRYKDDRYDRYWEASDINDSTKLSVSISDKIIITESEYHPPAIVMSTAVTAVNANAPLVISWEPENETDQFYVYMHFMDVQVLTTNQTRRFNVMLNGKLWYANCSPLYMGGNSIGGPTGLSGKEIKFSLERTENSTLPPIINAIESYRLIESHQSVDAITRIKSVYGVKRDWQGDLCAPATYLWDGLNCTYGDNEVPRITTLNLSSSGLSGNIDTSISNLIMLEKLDLSNNNLTGEVPDFLIQLQHLKILNLEKNDLSGSIPSSLIEKSHEGSLSLSVGQNPNLCESGECNETKKKNIVTPILLVSISGVLILLIAVAILWICKRKKSKDSVAVNHQNKISQQSTEKDDSLQSRKSQMYSYNDVLQITNNFNRIIGKGGFGTVYLGFINNTPVAVKMLSPSAVHGYKQFQAEVKLLIRVHHKNLTSLIGYCNEETNKALIYEYMAKGNLREHLSGKYNESPFLSWKERLRVAVDTAQGLEYLQNGCKPPIIHRDVKSTNILLDEHFQAKLSDFGLSKVVPDDGGSHVSTIVAGTVGYLDPHYHSSNRLTQKSDVYSFGVVLLEIITNQSVTGRNEENGHISERVSSMIPTGDIRAIVDSRLEGNFDINSAWKALEIAMACVSRNPNERPMMSVVVIELQETLATELARTEHNNGADPKYSVAAWSESELMPLAR